MDSLLRVTSCLLASGQSLSTQLSSTSIRRSLANGTDPLGERYSNLLPGKQRRALGATFTPPQIVRHMIGWAESQGVTYDRIVDPGAGSGRFSIAAARAFPGAKIIAIENDPSIAALLQANLAIAGLKNRVTVIANDYRAVRLPQIAGRTLFIGNPPYVRHHDIDPSWKRWYKETCRYYKLPSSALAGLHIHFLLKTRQLAVTGDHGCFITAAEWLDVNYGSTARAMLTNGLGGRSLHLIEKSVQVFPDAMTSTVILCFETGSRCRSMRVHHVGNVEELKDLRDGRPISLVRARAIEKWSQLPCPDYGTEKDRIELGELFQVHRGQVTGMNRVWIAAQKAHDLPPSVLVPTITRAKELIHARDFRLSDTGKLRRVVDLPADLDRFAKKDRDRIEAFLSWAQSQGAAQSYIARHRSPWWRVNLRASAPIVMTYMARRPPTFVLNACGARLLNIAHGLFPRIPLSEEDLWLIVRWLNRNVRAVEGRTYAGGLTKFEPKEVMRLRIPRLEILRAMEPVG